MQVKYVTDNSRISKTFHTGPYDLCHGKWGCGIKFIGQRPCSAQLRLKFVLLINIYKQDKLQKLVILT